MPWQPSSKLPPRSTYDLQGGVEAPAKLEIAVGCLDRLRMAQEEGGRGLFIIPVFQSIVSLTARNIGIGDQRIPPACAAGNRFGDHILETVLRPCCNADFTSANNFRQMALAKIEVGPDDRRWMAMTRSQRMDELFRETGLRQHWHQALFPDRARHQQRRQLRRRVAVQRTVAEVMIVLASQHCFGFERPAA
jgi:hypothetical protein